MKESQLKLKKRLAMIEFYYQVKDISTVNRLFKLSRKTFYKWLKRYESSGRKLLSLENISQATITKRSKVLDFKTELDIKHLREKYIRIGKVKLQKLFKREYGYYVSQSHIAYVIQKYNLYYDPFKDKRIRSKRKTKGKEQKKYE